MDKKKLRQVVRNIISEQEKIIEEGLTVSYSAESVYSTLLKNGFSSDEVIVEESFGDKVILVKIPNDTNKNTRIEELKRFFETPYGWRFSIVLMENGKKITKEKDLAEYKSNFILVQFEPSFDVELNKSEIPPLLFHLTPLYAFEKIKRIGLVPKSRSNSFSYSDRIYLTDKVDRLSELAKMFFDKKENLVKSKNNPTGEPSVDYVIFRAKIAHPNLKIRLFRDPNFENGYYTMDNIGPNLIKPVIKLKIENEGKTIKKEML